jgi:uncharacterized membrane protein YhaH (DUF805 family)
MSRNPYTPPVATVQDAAELSDLPAHQPGTLGFFFSTKGRLNRKHFWANGILSALLSPVLFLLIGAVIRLPWLPAVGMVVAAGSSVALVVRRTHDFGYSGWWSSVLVASLVLVAPILARVGVSVYWAFLILILLLSVFGLIPGDRAANKYGLPLRDDARPKEAV